MQQRIVTIDAFTDRPFGGNPAAVCLLVEPAEASWMQAVAREMNLSETAYLHPEREGYRLRWFTPVAEVELCGHATLASAHFLWEDGHLEPGSPAVFFTRSGRLVARRAGDWIEVDFPADRPVAGAVAPDPRVLAAALGATVVSSCVTGLYALVELESESVVDSIAPDFQRLRELHPVGISVTAPADDPEIDFVSRFFAPAVGIEEDPVTGSAHCSLGPFWGERLGKQEMIAHQISERRGVVRVRLAGDRVLLAGQAVTVLRGELVG